MRLDVVRMCTVLAEVQSCHYVIVKEMRKRKVSITTTTVQPRKSARLMNRKINDVQTSAGNNELLRQLLTDGSEFLGAKDVVLLVYKYLCSSFDPSNVTCVLTLKTKRFKGWPYTWDGVCPPLYWVRFEVKFAFPETWITVYNMVSGLCENSLCFREAFWAPFIYDSKLILRNDVGLSLYSIPDLGLIKRIPARSEPRCFAFVAQIDPGLLLMSHFCAYPSRTRSFFLLNVEASTINYERNYTSEEYLTNCFSIGGNKFVTCGERIMKVWEVKNEGRDSGNWLQLLSTHSHPHFPSGDETNMLYLKPHRVLFLHHGTRSHYYGFRIWDLTTGTMCPEVADNFCSPKFGQRINSEWFCIVQDKEVKIRDMQNGQIQETLSFPHQVKQIEVFPQEIDDDVQLAILFSNGSVKMYGNPNCRSKQEDPNSTS